MDVSQTLQTYCGYIEDVHMNFDEAENYFDRIITFQTLSFLAE